MLRGRWDHVIYEFSFYSLSIVLLHVEWACEIAGPMQVGNIIRELYEVPEQLVVSTSRAFTEIDKKAKESSGAAKLQGSQRVATGSAPKRVMGTRTSVHPLYGNNFRTKSIFSQGGTGGCSI